MLHTLPCEMKACYTCKFPLKKVLSKVSTFTVPLYSLKGDNFNLPAWL